MVLNTIRHPYLVAGGYGRQQDWIFFTPRGTIKLDGCNQPLQDLMPLLDGSHTVDEILDRLPAYDRDDLSALLALLAEHRIITDANRIYTAFHAYARYPAPFSAGLTHQENLDLFYDTAHLPDVEGPVVACRVQSTPLSTMLQRRTSTRRFSARPLDPDTLLNLMWTLYGRQASPEAAAEAPPLPGYTVPSGGGLYPLFLYLILFKRCGRIGPGIYRWHKESSLLERLGGEPDPASVGAVLIGVEAPCVASCTGVVCVVADFERMARKYGNHAYNLILLEAGHVMQNAYLFCSRHDLGVVEVYGILAEALSRMLAIDFPDQTPVIAAVFGTVDPTAASSDPQGPNPAGF